MAGRVPIPGALSVPSLSFASDDPLFAEMLRTVGGSLGGPPGGDGLLGLGSPACSWGGDGAPGPTRAGRLREPLLGEDAGMGFDHVDGLPSKRARGGGAPQEALKCLDVTHTAPCALCRPAPEDGTEEQYQLVGDVGKKNGAWRPALGRGQAAEAPAPHACQGVWAPLSPALPPCIRRREEAARAAEQDDGVEQRGREGSAGGAVRRPGGRRSRCRPGHGAACQVLRLAAQGTPAASVR